jgi:hypothetical protein
MPMYLTATAPLYLQRKKEKKKRDKALEDPVLLQKQRKIKAIFELLDTDGSGSVDYTELMVLSEIRGYDLTEKDLITGQYRICWFTLTCSFQGFRSLCAEVPGCAVQR